MPIYIILFLNNYTERQNYTYKHLSKNYFKYFYNSRIILSTSDNFKNKIINFVQKKAIMKMIFNKMEFYFNMQTRNLEFFILIRTCVI